MELKWLEDLICVAEKGHFARAASERFVTQSALSRRIKSLETWVGTELLDRSQHPIRLTKAGEEYIKTAKDIIVLSYEGRAITEEFSRLKNDGVKIACLHTLALTYIPNLVHKLSQEIGDFSTSVIAETRSVEEYLTGLYNGSSDFFVCYSHPSILIGVDPEQFPSIKLDEHMVRPYQSLNIPMINLAKSERSPISYVEFSPNTYMSRVVTQILNNAPFKHRLNTVYRASLSESTLTATQRGLGLSWLPETVVPGSPKDHGLRIVSDTLVTPLNIRLYKSIKNTNPVAKKIWDNLKTAKTFI